MIRYQLSSVRIREY